MSEERKTREDFDTDSDYATYKITHPEENLNEEDERVKTVLYYKCENPRCEYIKKQEIEINKSELELIKVELKKGICPKCGKTGFKLIEEKEYNEISEKIKKKEKTNKKEKIEEEALEKRKEIAKDVKYKIKDLYDDLWKDLKYGRITPETFSKLFYNVSYIIVNSANKGYRRIYSASFIDFKDLRKDLLSMIRIVLDFYEIKENEENILDEYDINDQKYKEMYDMYYEKYELEKSQKNDEYKLDSRAEYYKAEIEKNELSRTKQKKLSDKYLEKIKNKTKDYKKDDEMSFVKSLEKMVNKR